MTNILYIRLGSQQQDAVHWLIWSSADKSVVEQGELLSADETQLSTLKSKANSNKVVVFVPGSDVSLKALKVPGNSQRAIRLAAPYMLEDDLAEDVEQLFFAYGNVTSDNNGNNCFVAAVDEQQIEQWQLWLSDAGINTRVMIPDVLALPVPAVSEVTDNLEHWSAVGIDDQILVRRSIWQATVVDKSFWHVVTQSWLKSNKESELLTHINTYTDIPPISGAQVNVSVDDDAEIEHGLNIISQEDHASGLVCLAENSTKNPVLNLLQGKYKVTQKRSTALTNWYWAAGFVVAALLLNIVLKVSDLSAKQSHVASIEKQIISTYKKAFPKTKKVRVSTIKSQLKNKMRGISNASGGDTFLPMLSDLQPAFSLVPDLSVKSMKFDGKKNELRLQVSGSDYESFEKFTAAVQKMGMKVKQGAQNNQDNRITGSFSITNARKK